MSKLRPHLTYANVVSSVCLFIVLGGSAYAATVITGKNVQNGSLTGKDVKNKSLTRKDFRGSVPGPKGDTGPRGATGATGATGASGLNGERGPAGPGAIKLDYSETAQAPAFDPVVKSTLLFSREGLSITAVCTDTGVTGADDTEIALKFEASGAGATANAAWTDEISSAPNTTETRQDGVANGTLTVSDFIQHNAFGFRRLEGQAVLRSDTQVLTVAFHAFVETFHCKVDGTVIPAT